MLSVLVVERRRGRWRREVWWQAWGLLANSSHCLRVLCLGVLVWTLAIGKVDARDLDDGLPRGFLVGTIVKVWVAHRLDWAGELHGRRGEELP